MLVSVLSVVCLLHPVKISVFEVVLFHFISNVILQEGDVRLTWHVGSVTSAMQDCLTC